MRVANSIQHRVLGGGRYVIQTKLGQGGMGVVFRAYDRLSQHPVALKQVQVDPITGKPGSNGDNALLALALEFRVLAGLRHPNIVPVLDYGFDEQRVPYYTMNLLEGAKTITEVGQALDDSGKVRLLVQMLQALAYLHRRGVIHRDLKPGNVLVAADGHVQVTDFGLALLQGDAEQGVNGVVGTLAYIAPEIFGGTSASVASDLYAVGVILYELWVGCPPFTLNNIGATMMNIISTPVDVSPLPPAFQPLAARLLAKSPEERPRSAEEVISALCAASGVPLPQESLSVRESFLQASNFVGRDQELATLRAALLTAMSGGVSFWLVGGESGVGKSRLLDETRTHALIEGALVLRGQAVMEGGLPYQLWRDIARRLVLDTPLTDADAGVLKALVPEIGDLIGRTVPDAPELPEGAGQDRLIFALVKLLRHQQQPIVLLLEDLQWAHESLAPLKHLLTVYDQMQALLIIATYRDDEQPDLPQALNGMNLMTLPRLTNSEVAALVRAMLGEAGENEQVVNLLQRETEGNVFFMVETVRLLAETVGSLTAISGDRLPTTVITGGIQQLIERRLNRLPQHYRPLLHLAAVSGRQIDVRVLMHLVDELDVGQFLTAGAEASILEVVDSGWRFTHDKLREGVLHGLSAETVRLLNRRVAEAIEVVYPNNALYHEMLMGYWRLAEDTERELSYLLPVVHHLIDIRAAYAHGDELIKRGLALVSPESREMAVLLKLQSSAAQWRGDYRAAQDNAEQSLRIAEKLGIQEEIAASLFSLGVIAEVTGNYANAVAYFQRSLALCREVGDKRGIAVSLGGLGNTLANRGDYNEAAVYFEQSRVLHAEIGNKRGIAVGLNGLGTAAYCLKNFELAAAYFQQCLTIRREIGDKRGITSALNALGVIAYDQGNIRAGIAYLQECLSLAREIGYRRGVANTLAELAKLYHEQHSPELLETLQEGLLLSLHVSKTKVIELLVTVACWMIDQGDIRTAAQIAGLIEAHPATVNQIRQRGLANLRSQLATLLPAAEVEALMAQGERLDLETTARAWLDRLTAEAITGTNP